MPEPLLIVTGIPRSGTTLTADLIDRLENTVCINEPREYYQWVMEAPNKLAFIERMRRDITQKHQTLLAGGSILDRRLPDGSVPHNYFEESGVRRDMAMRPVRHQSDAGDPLLAVKHNELFTSVLPEICQWTDARVIAIVRHPIPVILSWQSTPIPLNQGHLSPGYRFWPKARAIEAEGGVIVDVQAKIYELFCARYWTLRERLRILKYEDIIANPGVLEDAAGRKLTSQIELRSQNRKHADRYGAERVELVKSYIARHFHIASQLYPDLDT